MAGLTPHTTCATHTTYRLTCSEFDALRAANPGRCHWCGKTEERLDIDHDHALGDWAVRGLLCRRCNTCIQLVESGVHEMTGEAAAYLANAWHLKQASTAAKQRRAAPRMKCPTCEQDCATRKNGTPTVHWCRLPGRLNEICPASL